jgi:hypothetical protein
MKTATTFSITNFLVILTLMFSPIFGQNLQFERELNAAHEAREKDVKNTYKPLVDLTEKYRIALEKYKDNAKEIGDLDALIAVQKELDNLDVSVKLITFSKDIKVSNIQKKLKEQQGILNEKILQQISLINRNYINQLEDLVKKLTQAGSIDEAIQIRNLREDFINKYNLRETKKETLNNDKPIKSSQKQKIVAIDRYHGRSEYSLNIESSFKKMGWQVRYIDSQIDDSSLKGASIYFIDRGKVGSSIYNENELSIIKSFYVSDQGSLIVIGVNWHWELYEKQSKESLPANQIGKSIGFSLDNDWSSSIEDSSQIQYDDFLASCNLGSITYRGEYMNHVRPKPPLRGKFKTLVETSDGKTAMALVEYDSSSCVISGSPNYFTNSNYFPVFQCVIKYLEAKMALPTE